MNVILLLEFGLANFEASVQHTSHYTTVTLQQSLTQLGASFYAGVSQGHPIVHFNSQHFFFLSSCPLLLSSLAQYSSSQRRCLMWYYTVIDNKCETVLVMVHAFWYSSFINPLCAHTVYERSTDEIVAFLQTTYSFSCSHRTTRARDRDRDIEIERVFE